MAEAEDVITDVARHATAYTQALWRRHRPLPKGPETWGLEAVAVRLDLLVTAVFGQSWPIRAVQAPVPAGLLERLRRGPGAARIRVALPATDGLRLWLPADLGMTDAVQAAECYRLMALQQAMRARRASAAVWCQAQAGLEQDLLLMLEADAADAELLRCLPGLAQPLQALRERALAGRPPLSRCAEGQRLIEQCLQTRLARSADQRSPSTAEQSLHAARVMAAELRLRTPSAVSPMVKDLWTGELRAPPAGGGTTAFKSAGDETAELDARAPRSARLPRTPRARAAPEDEDDATPGAWMVQASPPHEMAADPMGLQRPTDRDTDTAAEEFAEDLSELAQARLVSTPGASREVLLSDEPIELPARQAIQRAALLTAAGSMAFDYPEWNYKTGVYQHPGARVHVLPAPVGDAAWVQATLAQHRGLLAGVRRGFEMLRSERASLRRQLDGDGIDLEALVEARADFAAGLPMSQAVYLAERPARRSLAITLLVDISGSTDSWVAAGRRIIDVEREALLLVCVALEGLREPYSVLAFSGQGMTGVTVRELKRFDEAYGEAVALRIAALEPEHYTRTGAAMRHAVQAMMAQPARHRLLLLLSDGKPNDNDAYEGRHGVEDLRQAVAEARLQGISPFCLTVDRLAAAYMGRVFGQHHYTLLRNAELLPAALLDWMRRLLQH